MRCHNLQQYWLYCIRSKVGWIVCVTHLMNKYYGTIFSFTWEVVIFPSTTTYLPHYCSKYWTLFQDKCTNLVDRTRATIELHFHYYFLLFIICRRFYVKIFNRFLKLFHPRWYVKNFEGFWLMASFHKVSSNHFH